MSKKNIESTYKKLTDIEHVLLRPDTYIGSVQPSKESFFLPKDLEENKYKFQNKEIEFSPGFIKIFDEIITNASDHAIKTSQVKYIKVNIKDDGYICIENDGPGIPVIIHKEYKQYVPEFLFFETKTGSNYDDTEQRMVAGRNGLGAALTCIFSKEFTVETSDGKKLYIQTSYDNLAKKSTAKISKSSKTYTKITFLPDYERFQIKTLTEDYKKLLFKRTLDIAAYLPNVKVYFNDSLIPIKSSKDYMKMHIEDDAELFYERLSNEWEIGFAKSPTDVFVQVSLVNGVNTYKGGTHITHVSNEAAKEVLTFISKGKQNKITWNNVKNKMFVFLISKIANPTFSSQTKENLTNYIGKDVLQGAKISEIILKKLSKSDIIKSILEEIELKELRDLKRINQDVQTKKVEKLIDAKNSNRKLCHLFLFEGDSAKSAFRRYRDPSTQGAFPLRGKFLNITDMKGKDVIKNEEVKNLLACLGLHIGEKVKLDELKYHRIYLCMDYDTDGDNICALMLNFFYRYWPELFEKKMVYRVNTPLLVVTKGKNKKCFYNSEEFDKWLKTSEDHIKWEVSYKKGLAALEDDEYRDMIQNPFLTEFNGDKNATENLDIWFGKSTEKRKEKLINI